jgi:octaprenyl-diphosphate synthase
VEKSLGLSQIFEPIRADLEKVDEEFARHVQSRVQLIPQIGQYIRTSGGKRMRPAVLLMAARLSGYTGDRSILYAAVVEFIHTATLVHDDIIDDADLRRGRLAVHSRWGNDITVLLGDYLYIKSMALALTHDTLDIVRLLCDVTLKMIEGELFQLTKNGDADITEEEHFDIMRRKTAYLFGGCSARCRRIRNRRCASTGSISGWPSNWSTTCWITPATKKPLANRSAATCAKAK